MFSVLLYFHSELVEALSTSHFIKDSTTDSWTNILCMSSSSWPSWLPLLTSLFSNNSTPITITVLAKSRDLHNLFGINRSSSVTWLSHSPSDISPNHLSHMARLQDAIFFDGSLQHLSYIYDTVQNKIPFGKQPLLFASMNWSFRLNTLKQFKHITWSHLKHEDVGGCSTIRIWLGVSACTSTATPPLLIVHLSSRIFCNTPRNQSALILFLLIAWHQWRPSRSTTL